MSYIGNRAGRHSLQRGAGQQLLRSRLIRSKLAAHMTHRACKTYVYVQSLFDSKTCPMHTSAKYIPRKRRAPTNLRAIAQGRGDSAALLQFDAQGCAAKPGQCRLRRLALKPTMRVYQITRGRSWYCLVIANCTPPMQSRCMRLANQSLGQMKVRIEIYPEMLSHTREQGVLAQHRAW